KFEGSLRARHIADPREFFADELREQCPSGLVELVPRFAGAITQLDLSDVFPDRSERRSGFRACTKERRERLMHDLAEDEACRIHPRPELLHVVEPVLLGTEQIAIDPRMREMRRPV